MINRLIRFSYFSNCQKCSNNKTECLNNIHCERFTENVITANRQSPGPSIRVSFIINNFTNLLNNFEKLLFCTNL